MQSIYLTEVMQLLGFPLKGYIIFRFNIIQPTYLLILLYSTFIKEVLRFLIWCKNYL